MEDVFIVSAVRTPTGKFLGALKGFKATELGAMVVSEAVSRAGLKSEQPEHVDEVIMGNVVSAGLGQNPARQAALAAGLPPAGRSVHDQQGVRVGLESSDARPAGDHRRRRGGSRRRGDGIDVERALSRQAHERRSQARSRRARGRGRARRAVGYLQRLPHGHDW